MATDALAPCVTRPPAAMVLTILDKPVIAFHEEGFQLTEPPKHVKKGKKM